MKKLMIAAAMVCAAAISQAAVVTWGSSAQIKCDTTVQSGATVQLFLVNYDGKGTDLQIDERATTSTGAKQNQGKLGGGSGEMQDGFVFGENTYEGQKFTIDATSQVYAKIVSLDGAYEQFTEAAALTGLSATQRSTVTFTFGSAIADTPTAGKWSAVPEPTTGLLMLLGMAGLALRRRRA